MGSLRVFSCKVLVAGVIEDGEAVFFGADCALRLDTEVSSLTMLSSITFWVPELQKKYVGVFTKLVNSNSFLVSIVSEFLEDRRANPRLDLHEDVLFRMTYPYGVFDVQAHLENISLTGMAFTTATKLSLGREVSYLFTKTSFPCQLAGKVVREETRVGTNFYAVSFFPLDDLTHSRFATFLQDQFSRASAVLSV